MSVIAALVLRRIGLRGLKMLRQVFLTLAIGLSWAPSASAEQPIPEGLESPRIVVHLLDYLAKDYAGAVDATGKVLSESEYAEQVEFAKMAVKAAETQPVLSSSSSLKQSLATLLSDIQSKASPEKVAPLAREIQREVIRLAQIKLEPIRWPLLESGQRLFAANCVSCHGATGAGNGPLGEGLDPPPANFVDAEGMKALTPFAAFNTIRLGVPGTGMAPFAQFSDQEVWELAFYVNSLRFSKPTEAVEFPADWSPENDEVLGRVASRSDNALKDEMTGSVDFKDKLLAALRLHEGKRDQMSFLTIASTKLKEAGDHFDSKEFELAKTKALQAYLEGIEPIEPRLRATDPQSLVDIEDAMGRVRLAIESRSEETGFAIAEAQEKIVGLRPLLTDHEMSEGMAFLASFFIILREGFEAVLIILALLGVVRAAGSKKAALYVHGGWLTATVIGIVAWFLSGWLMASSGASREYLEGITSVLAVLVLLYVGFWLHRQTEIGRWKAFLEVKVKHFLSGGNLLGLGFIAFMATFREALETVLFLRSIWLDLGQEAKVALFAGVVSSFVLVILLSWIALNYSRRLPLRTLFNASSAMMLVLATILAGKGVHALQEAGVFDVGAVPLKMRFELFGFYPTSQTLLAQVVTALLVGMLWYLGTRPSSKVAVESRTK